MKKTPLVFVLLVLLGFSVSAQGSQVSEDIKSYGIVRYSVSTSTLMVNGSKIVDKYGNEVKLRGFQLWGNDYVYGFGDREPYAPQWVQDKWMPLTQEHLNQIKRWGFNVVHIGPYWTGTRGPSEPYEDQPQVYNEEGLAIFLELIRMANEAGLYVIVEARVSYDPVTMPLWAGWSTNDYVVFNQLDSAGQRGLERFSTYLEWLTQNTCGEPNVVGIEPWHFPYHKQGEALDDNERMSKYFNNVVPAMIQAVRKHTDKIIFLNPPVLGGFDYNNHPGPYDDPNIVYATGGYGYHDTAYTPNTAPWDYTTNKAYFRPHHSWLTFRDKYKVPMMSTEGPGLGQHNFGRPLPQDRLDLFDAVLTICDDMNGWIVHQYTGPGGVWGVLENENPNDPASEGQVVEILKKHTPP